MGVCQEVCQECWCVRHVCEVCQEVCQEVLVCVRCVCVGGGGGMSGGMSGMLVCETCV